MEKHLFRVVSRGSSNTIMLYGLVGKEMKRNAILVLIAAMIASMLVGLAYAQPTVEASPNVVKPGETVTISGQGTAGANVIIEISNTRTVVDTYNISLVSSGVYSIEYSVPIDSPIDIYTVTTQVNGETTETSFIVSRMTQQQLSNTIRTLVERAKKQAESALIQARKQNHAIPPEIRAKYQQGIDAIESAKSHIQSHEYSEAHEALREALNLFREIVEYSFQDDVAPPIDPEQAHVKVQDMINQLQRQYKEIYAIVQRLKQKGLSLNLLERDLNTLRNRIDEAQALLDDGKILEAEQSIARTTQLLRQKLAALRQRQAEITKILALKYQMALENRVDAFIDTFQKLQSVRPVQSALALNELEALKQKLDESDALLEQDKIPEALRWIHYTEYRLRRLSDLVNGDTTSRLLKRIDELTANLQESTGTDASQIEEEIEDTKDTLNDYLRRRLSTDSDNTSLTP